MNHQSLEFVVKPRPYTGPTEDELEAQEELADNARAQARSQQAGNRVSAFLGETFYRVDKTWPCLYWKLAGVQLSVGMYFPRLNLAVDRFPKPDSMQRQEAAFKAMELRRAGVQYKALFPENKLAELAGYTNRRQS